MSSIKDNIEVQSQGLILGIQELLLRFTTAFKNQPKSFRVIIIALVLLITLGTAVTRIGVEQFLTLRYKQNILLAHSSFTSSEGLSVGEIKVLSTAQNRYTAYAVISNENLELSAETINYTFQFYNSSGEAIYTANGKTYITPNEKKWIVVPRIETLETISRAELSFAEINWQKKFDTPKVELKMVQPFLSDLTNPKALVTEGTVVNNSPFALNEITLILVLYDNNDKVISVTQRNEFSLKAFERRGYNLQWPGLTEAQVDRIDLQAYTNTLDPNNVSVTGQQRTIRETPDDR